MNRFSGSLFVPPLLATTVFVFVSYGAQWRGQWNWTIDTITGSTVLTGPLTAALGAYLAVGQRRIAALSDSAPLGWLVPYRVGLQALMLSSVVYVAGAAGALLVTALGTHGGPISWWALIIGFPVLGVCALFGAAVGHWWPYRVTVLVVAPVVFLFGAFGPHPAADLLRHGPETGSLAGLAFDEQVWSAQVAALVAAGCCLAASVLPWRDPGNTIVRLSVAGVSVVGLVAALVAADQVGTERFVASDERPTACAGSRPRVCLAPSDRTELVRAARAMDRAAAVLAAGGVAVPDVYEELLPGYQPPVGVGMTGRSSGFQDGDELRSGAANLTVPSACPAWTDPALPPPDPAFDARMLITEWIVLRGGGTPAPFSHESQVWLTKVEGQDANAWVTVTFAALRACDLESIRLPWQTTAS
ncbi:hypothetical protein [Nocardioides sp.]|uniref:hypothetical protein n=1 Tax=Nocardioides sp. TaxID=35761 RepID=UPI003D0D1BB5